MTPARKARIAAGTACLIAAALAMGWFVGRYVPGEPLEPSADPSEVLSAGSGRAAKNVVDFNPGDEARIPSLVQGLAYEASEELLANLSRRQKEDLDRLGFWKIEHAGLSLAVSESRIISAQSFANWNTAYASPEKVLSDGSIILVAVSMTNASDASFEAGAGSLPTFTLWSDLLVGVDDAMGAGIALDLEAYALLNPGEAVLAPGETRQIVLPFRIVGNALANPSELEGLRVESFALQTSDYAAATTYRLWL